MSNEMKDVFSGTRSRVVERRKGLDRRGKIGLALSVVGWSLWAVGMYLVSLAAPQNVTFIDRFMDKTARSTWTTGFLYFAEALWAMGALLSVMSLFQFRRRYRRRADKKHAGIITALIINALFFVIFGIVIFMIDF